ncbi:biotin transporter BioY [Demequina sp. NBRC 110056]|uniref:biotin transporter BioY n=1 Tax=Demequina sp. NBRC 110056 TaxID=1570345 RepID=UPI000A06D45B|nr:biotin transporter BioY [Demequina sp. NBRC 110056]
MRRHVNGPTIALVAVFAAFIAASTAVPEVTLAGGIPLTLQTFAVVLAGLCLGPWRGSAAVLLYLVVGLAGAPIFANTMGGIGVLAGATGGYLVGMVIAAWVVGALAAWNRRRGTLNVWTLIASGLVSIPVIYAVGVPWLAVRTGLPVWQSAEGCTSILDTSDSCLTALSVGVIPFLPGDLIKVVLAAVVASIIHRAYPQLLPGRRVPVPSDVDRTEATTA